MKLIRLSLNNLNSLYGRVEVDFTHSEFQESGIFGIIGRTGAGKTTLLDAVCLALFGTTPRLKEGGSDKTDAVMSRGTAESEASVVFAVNGKCYCAQWSRRLARTGTLQASKRKFFQVADPVSGEAVGTVLEKSREIQKEVEEVTGMSFERFTRTMLLAQGDFTAFLKSDEKDRAEILENITGSEIYRQISAESFQRLKESREKLALVQAGLENLQTLSDEELLEKKKLLSEKKAQSDQLSESIKAAVNASTWLERKSGFETKKQELTPKVQELREKTELSQSALQRQQKSWDEKKQERESLQKIWNQVRLMDQEIQGLEQQVKELLAEETLDQEKLQTYQRAVAEIAGQIVSLEQTVVTLEEWRSKNQQLKAFSEELSGWEVQVANHRKNREELGNMQPGERTASLEELRLQFHDVNEQLQKLLQQNFEAQKRPEEDAIGEWVQAASKAGTEKYHTVKQWEVNLEKANQEKVQKEEICTTLSKEIQAQETLLKQEKEGLEASREKKQALEEKLAVSTLALKQQAAIQGFAHERTQLKEGEACPLCGAESHPFAGLVAEPELLQRLQSSVDSDTIRLQEQGDALHELQQKVRFLEEKALPDLHGRLNEAKSSLEKVETELREIGERLAGENTAKQIFEQNEELENTWARLSSLSKELKYAESQAEIQKEEGRLIAGMQKACGMDKSSQTLADVLVFAKDKAEEWKQAELQYTQAQNDLAQNKARKENGKEAVQKKEIEIQSRTKKVASLQKKLQQVTAERKLLFADKELSTEEKAFTQSYLLVEKEFQQCQQEFNQLDRSLSSVEADLKTAEAGLSNCLESVPKRIEDDQSISVEMLEQESDTLKQEQQALLVSLGEIQAVLQQDLKAREQLKEKAKEIKQHEAMVERWRRLADLIGSADGSKFQRFAQSLTFTFLIHHANEQLALMTDRYLLIPKENTALQFSVVDQYQGGEIRTVENLSGGESFLVSLALALGLSSMSSHKKPVDTLFLDEGFGTLDEETLQGALDALASLKQHGKLIGIISHVPKLKESLAVQLRVHTKSGGKSKIVGPGVNLDLS